MQSSPASPSGLAFALGSACFYGLNIGYARLASFSGISGSTIAVYRVLLMLAVVAAFAALLRQPLKVAPEERGTMAVLGIATAFMGICYLSSVTFIPVTVAVVLFYTYPILIVLASPLVEGTRLTPSLLGVVGLALTGVVMVVGPAFGSLDWRGIALALGASVSTATQFFAAARCRRTNVVAKTLWIHLLVLPTAALIGWAAGSLTPPSTLTADSYAVAMTIAGYVFAFVLQLLALARVSAVAAGIVYCAEPVVAAISAAFILGERLNGLQFIGGALVLMAIIGNVLLEQRRSKAPLVPIAD
jgi:drug/metabolite transporter (DMT)-like permease